jgi:hypothetical protein
MEVPFGVRSQLISKDSTLGLATASAALMHERTVCNVPSGNANLLRGIFI